MYRLKSCPRCGGDLIGEETDDEFYLKCMACSREFEHRLVGQRRDRASRPVAYGPARPGRPRKERAVA